MTTTQFDLDSCMMLITTRSSKLFSTKFNQVLKEKQISRSEWMTLYYINREAPVIQHTLTELVGITGPSMVTIISKLNARGVLTIEPSPTDKRERLISLSPAGQDLLTNTLPIADQFQTTVTAGISQSDLDTVARVMAKMVENAKQI